MIAAFAIYSAIVAVLGAVLGIVIGVATNLLSDEAKGWMEVAPVALLRLAARRLPSEIRDELYADWYADLVAELRSVEKMPISRFTVGMRFATGLFFGARTIANVIGSPETARTVRRTRIDAVISAETTTALFKAGQAMPQGTIAEVLVDGVTAIVSRHGVDDVRVVIRDIHTGSMAHRDPEGGRPVVLRLCRSPRKQRDRK